MVLLTAFKIVLHRYTQLTDVIVGSPITDRPGSEYEHLLGCFLNTLVLRSDLSGDPDIHTLLARVRRVTLGAFDHADVPFEKLVEELQPARLLSRSPLIQVLFALQNMPVSTVQLDNIAIEQFDPGIVAAKTDIALFLQESKQGLHVSIAYNRDLFDVTRMVRLAGHFQRVLEAMLADPMQRISEIDLLLAEEQQWLGERNAQPPAIPDTLYLHELFEKQAGLTPHAPAIVFEQERLSYAELNQRANQLAHYLQKAGVGPGTLVGIYLERSLTVVISILAVLKAGGGYVPLDPAHPVERLALIVRDAQISLLLAQHIENPFEYEVSILCPDKLWQVIAQESVANPDCAVTSHDIAYVMYTSGSTGLPKGVVIEHGGLGEIVAGQVRTFRVQSHERIAHFASFSFDVSVTEMFLAFLVGAQLFLIPQEQRWPVQALEHYLQEYAITTATLPPSVLAHLSSTGLPALHTVISTGEELPLETATRWSVGRQLFNAYGPTEATVYATIASYSAEIHPPSIGYPVPGTQAYILDSHYRFVPPGSVGELFIGGIGVARGYLNRPRFTSERFLPDPFSDVPGACLYRTGDKTRYLPGGDIEFLGRADNQVKIRGYRIELEDIESVLRTHPVVQDCAVNVWEEAGYDKRLVAYIVTPDIESMDHKPSLSEMRSFLKTRLPEYMVPAYLVLLDALPLTVNGKLDRRSLPAPNEVTHVLSTAFIAPCTETEQQLARIWCDLLHLQQVGRDDSFFEIGGHSLLLTLMLVHVQETFQVNLSLRTAFQAATLMELAERIDQMKARGAASLKSTIPVAPRQAVRIPVAVPGGPASLLGKRLED
jgi:amino acid adenylation domain-containing protein